MAKEHAAVITRERHKASLYHHETTGAVPAQLSDRRGAKAVLAPRYGQNLAALGYLRVLELDRETFSLFTK